MWGLRLSQWWRSQSTDLVGCDTMWAIGRYQHFGWHWYLQVYMVSQLRKLIRTCSCKSVNATYHIHETTSILIIFLFLDCIFLCCSKNICQMRSGCVCHSIDIVDMQVIFTLKKLNRFMWNQCPIILFLALVTAFSCSSPVLAGICWDSKFRLAVMVPHFSHIHIISTHLIWHAVVK